MKKIFSYPESLTSKQFHYCPGCGHGIAHRLISEIVDELDISKKVIALAPVGCAVVAYDYWNFDCCEAAHGRALAVATGIKRVRPENIVFTYQGDGDLAAIGTGETIHAANRGENITVFFVNNAIYGMTGGQMAPTTLEGQVTTTSPYGRQVDHCGSPIRVCEMLSTLDGAKYIERVAVNNVKNVKATKRAIKKAFETQINGEGFALIEVLGTCSTNWGLSPVESLRWLEEKMLPHYPLGVFKGGEK